MSVLNLHDSIQVYLLDALKQSLGLLIINNITKQFRAFIEIYT